MKKLGIIPVMLLMANTWCVAQDSLTYKNGKVVVVKVMEINGTEVRFRKTDNLDGPVYKERRSAIAFIKFENGVKESFSAQEQNETTETQEEGVVKPRLRYNGPRVGLTVIGGGTTQKWFEGNGKTPVISQFGWQFETRLFTFQSGTSALVEWVVLVGGADQGMFLPSGTMLLGIRDGKEGLEFGIGPSMSITGISMAIAVGGSIRSEKACIPINLAIIPSVNKKNGGLFVEEGQTGWRFSLLIGFNTRVR